MGTKTANFRLVPTHAFDARRGFSRWVIPGIGTRTTERGSLAEADLWIDRQGNLFTRFASQGYSLHFRIKSVLSDRVTPAMKDDVENFLHDMLITWVVDGVDDDLECDSVEYDDM